MQLTWDTGTKEMNGITPIHHHVYVMRHVYLSMKTVERKHEILITWILLYFLCLNFPLDRYVRLKNRLNRTAQRFSSQAVKQTTEELLLVFKYYPGRKQQIISSLYAAVGTLHTMWLCLWKQGTIIPETRLIQQQCGRQTSTKWGDQTSNEPHFKSLNCQV